MVRMRGVLPIGALRFFSASDFRVIHPAGRGVASPVNARWRVGNGLRMLSPAVLGCSSRYRGGPALTMSHCHGSATAPLMCTSK